ncbi:MAG: hypothetical protein JWM62_227, partial [Frankiales bacterium]|nr:hypothetical protein [Frankiales bacterium]
MTVDEQVAGAGRKAAAAGLSCALLALGLVLVSKAGVPPPEQQLPVGLVSVVLLVAYLFGDHYTLDFEYRRESNRITLV